MKEQTDSNNRKYTPIGQGIVYMKGIGIFVNNCDNKTKLTAEVERLSQKHVDLFGLLPQRLALSLHITEKIFIEQASINYKGDKIGMGKAWNKLFRKVEAMFIVASTKVS